jgi:hypothetical protein
VTPRWLAWAVVAAAVVGVLVAAWLFAWASSA